MCFGAVLTKLPAPYYKVRKPPFLVAGREPLGQQHGFPAWPGAGHGVFPVPRGGQGFEEGENGGGGLDTTEGAQ